MKFVNHSEFLAPLAAVLLTVLTISHQTANGQPAAGPGPSESKPAEDTNQDPIPPADDAADAPPADELRQLMIERRDTLRSIIALFRDRFELGGGSLTEAYIILTESLEAELDLCETADERIRALEMFHEHITQLHDHVKKAVAAGEATKLDLMKVTAGKLKAQILLRREQAKQ